MRAHELNSVLLDRLNHTKDRVLQGSAAWMPHWLTPNMISCLRVLLVIPLILLYRNGQVAAAAIIFAVALYTDALDGVQARRLRQETTIGKLLDPAADKVLIISLFFTVAVGRISSAVITTLVALEITLVLLAAVIGPLIRRFTRVQPRLGANNAGKIKMTLESIGVGILIFAPSGVAVDTAAEIILWIAAVFAALSIALHLFLRERRA